MKKILTLILDGFGMKDDVYGNPVKNAGMSNFIDIWNNYPHSLLKASEEVANLDQGESINSELAHQIIGSGHKVKNKYQIMKEAVNKNLLINSSKYTRMLKYLKINTKNIHIIYMVSESKLISNFDDLKCILNNLEKEQIDNIYLHLITDGEDSSKFYSLEFINKHSDDLKNVKIASLCGRYYACDKTKDYSKTELYYNLLVNGKGVKTPSIEKIIKLCYEKKITDAYLPPTKTKEYKMIEDGDVVFFLNYGRNYQYQIISSLVDNNFDEFRTKKKYNPKIFTLFEVSKKLKNEYFLKEEKDTNTICEYFGKLGFSQARITEEIKSDSLIYYLDGARDLDIDNCENYILKSNQLEYIEKKPEMKALNIAKLIVKCMENDYDFIIANFANPDIIGHTGNFQATINALQAIDVCLGKIIEVAKENFYKVIIIGSHSNCDTIIDRENNIITKNTINRVPFIIMDNKIKLKNGDITMITPTIFKYLDISLPKEMKDEGTLIIDKDN